MLAGVLVALVVRVLFGAGDPREETRLRIAGVLDARRPDVSGALETWVSDGRPTWLGQVLDGAVRYRIGLQETEREVRTRSERPAEPAAERPSAAGVEPLRRRAAQLAEQVRAKDPDLSADGGNVSGAADVSDAADAADVSDAADAAGVADDEAAPRPTAATGAPDPSENAVSTAAGTASAGLDQVAAALAHRDDSTATPHAQERELYRAARRPTWRARSTYVRHAVRTALGMLIMLVITATLRPGDPLVATVLLAAFAILQASWSESLARARPRLVGVVVGALVAFGVFLFAPAAALLPVSLVALVVGLWVITDRPAIGNGCMVLVSVGLNVSTRHLDPVGTLVEYTVLMLAAVFVSLVLGFVVVPGPRLPSLDRRIHAAWHATGEALAEAGPRAAAGPDSKGRNSALVRALREASAARADLLVDSDRWDPDVAAHLEDYDQALSDLVLVGLQLRDEPETIAALTRDFRAGVTARGDHDAFEEQTHLIAVPRALMDEARTAGTALLNAVPAG